MIVPGLTAGDSLSYLEAVHDGTRIDTRIDVLDRNRKYLRSVPMDTLAGSNQVTFTNGQAIRRGLSLTIVDPRHDLGWDTPHPTQGFRLLGYLLRPVQRVWVPGLGRWAEHPMGAFVPAEPSREGGILQLTGEDRASLYLLPRPAGRLPKNTNKVAALESAFARYGETDMVFPSASSAPARTGPKDIPYGGSDEEQALWRVGQRLLDPEGLELYTDAWGRIGARKPPEPGNPVVRWSAASLTSEPGKTADLRVLRNDTVVTGKTTGQGRNKRAATVQRSLPAADDLSPEALAVGGVPFRATAYESQPKMTQTQLVAFAARHLGRVASQQVRLTLQVLPAWHVNPGDYGLLEWRGVEVAVPIEEATIPFDGSPMQVGLTRSWRL